MSAKKVAWSYKPRSNWKEVNIKGMKWVLRQKLIHSPKLGDLLVKSGDLPIVEISYKDRFWGAHPDKGNFVGVNAIGRLLMELRKDLLEAKGREKPYSFVINEPWLIVE